MITTTEFFKWFGMRHAFCFYGLSCRQFECVLGLQNQLRFRADERFSVLSFPEKPGKPVHRT